MSKTVILIPSRLSATRLPGKPLLKAKGIPLIAHVYKKAKETKIGKVFVVTGDKKIFKALKKFTNNCIITKNKHRTGTDRIYEGAKKLRLNKNDYVLNLQGDEPLISVKDINRLIKVIIRKKLKIGTLACQINDNKVKRKFNDTDRHLPIYETGVDFMSSPREALGQYIKNKLIDLGSMNYGDRVTEEVLEDTNKKELKFKVIGDKTLYLEF